MGKSTHLPACSSSQHCSQWARIYLKYCLCNAKDGAALFLGTVSMISWGIAEVPQIITNYREKSTEGLSLTFLMTWIIGDLFNLIGCLLEPATLPTQYYVALLYTATTVVLAGQTIYYGHIFQQVKANNCGAPRKDDALAKESLLGDASRSGANQENGARPSKESPTSPIPVSGQVLHQSSEKDFYCRSARFLKRSPVPAFGYWLSHSQDNGRASPVNGNEQSASRDPLLNEHVSAQSAPPNLVTKNILSVVPSAALFTGIFVLHFCIHNVHISPINGRVITSSRQLLQDMVQDDESNGVGTLLGWAMAAIYMGGRLPQIWLNIRRGNVQGLNPLMFFFALTGNVTYVGSILVKSLDWSRIEPNLPWLVDAGGCVILDAFILIQFAYFYHQKHKQPESEDNFV
ncbi:seven transmembrane protein 1-like [Canna indica]|uniref:Seven transmembrane protein 1-like n=1 Tax=Canna indica TaxID=4628 RepID=A0AAQ3QJA1_9LILI|nr:seven transmembrane protein 1-like [Canna indica]